MFLSKTISAVLGLCSLLAPAAAFTNPIRNPGGGDPHLVYTEGYYYLLTTTWSNVQIARSTTIDGLKTATKKVVYSDSTASRCCNVWAPEVHYLGGLWYIYYTAGNNNNLDGQRLHVLKGGASPWDDYTYVRQLTPDWAIDGSVLRFDGYGNFMMSSCFHGVEDQSICLQQLGPDFTSLTGSIYVISQPDQSWEQHRNPVNEGPAALYVGGKTYIAYSASDCWTQYYCLGLLTWDGTTNPTSASAWTKSDGCVFESANGNYGAGHNSFFRSPSGNQTWIAYHATSNANGACNDSRYTMVQMLGTNPDGSADFGSPVDFNYVNSEPV